MAGGRQTNVCRIVEPDFGVWVRDDHDDKGGRDSGRGVRGWGLWPECEGRGPMAGGPGCLGLGAWHEVRVAGANGAAGAE